jgi:hypothetical protein
LYIRTDIFYSPLLSCIFITFMFLHSLSCDSSGGDISAKKENYVLLNRNYLKRDKPVTRNMTNELQIPVCPSHAYLLIRTNYCCINDVLLFVEVSHSKPCPVGGPIVRVRR